MCIRDRCYTELVTTADQAAQRGMTSAGIYTEWNNFGNYEEALFKNQDYLPKLTESLGAMVPQVIVVMIFSLFIALLLNQKFRGRTFARAVFFLPCLLYTSSGLYVLQPAVSCSTRNQGSVGLHTGTRNKAGRRNNKSRCKLCRQWCGNIQQGFKSGCSLGFRKVVHKYGYSG